MRRRLAALGGTAAAGAVAAVLVAGPGGPGPLSPPAAGADELPAFGSCAQLRQWYVDATLPQVGPWGLGYPGGIYAAGRGSVPLAGAETSAADARTPGPDQAVGNGSTGTNVQEAGVDEPDVAKTNGRIVVHVHGRDVVVTDVTGRQPHELSRVRLRERLLDPELLLAGDRVVLFGDELPAWGGPIGYDIRRPDVTVTGPDAAGPEVAAPEAAAPDIAGPVAAPGEQSTHIVTVDVSDPAAARIESDQRVDGGLLSARLYDGTVRAVVTTGYPPFDFVQPNRDRSPAEARRLNRQVVRDTPIGDWLPKVATDGGTRTPLLDCTDVRHPRAQSGFGTISVLTFPADHPLDRAATAVTAGGDLVYSSADRLYIATTAGGWWRPLLRTGAPVPSRRLSTEVHAFAVDGADTRYVASGRVPGSVRDRWSFDEYDGHLRVATALGARSWSPRENAVVVLDEAGDRLRLMGRVAGIGVGERIESVRWFGDTAVVVTFRQTDPLYTLDLSDPARPKVAGAVKIPGFSSYLHPVGGDVLLGLGQDATAQGAVIGAQVSTFDLSDRSRPRRVDTLGLGGQAYLTAGTDPRAFSYLPEQRLAVTGVTDYGTGRSRVVSFHVGHDGALAMVRSVPVGQDATGLRALPLRGSTVALVTGGAVRLVDVG